MKFLSKWTKQLEIVSVVIFYNLSAISTIIFNKYYLRTIPIPLCLLLLQMITSSLLLSGGYLLYNYYNSSKLRKKNNTTPLRVTVLESINMLWPMIVCNVFGLALNIICLSKLDSIVHQVTRSMTLPLTAIIGPFVGSPDTLSWRIYLLCFVMFTGFLIAISGEFNSKLFSIYGTGAGFISSLVNAYGAHFIKNRLCSDQFSALDLVFYNNIYSTILLAPIAISYEYSLLTKISDWSHVLLASIVTGILGVLINYAGFLQIKVTSALTHCVSSAARGMLQIAASYLLLKEHLNASRGIGISISLFASSLYPIVKVHDNNHTRHQDQSHKNMKELNVVVGSGSIEKEYCKIEIEINEMIENTAQTYGKE